MTPLRCAAIAAAMTLVSGCATIRPRWSEFRAGKTYAGMDLDDVRTVSGALKRIGGQNSNSPLEHWPEPGHLELDPPPAYGKPAEPGEIFAQGSTFLFQKDNSPDAGPQHPPVKAPIPVATFEVGWAAGPAYARDPDPRGYLAQARALGLEVKGFLGCSDLGMLFETNLPGYYAGLEGNDGPDHSRLARVLLVKSPEFVWGEIHLRTLAAVTAGLEAALQSHASDDAIEILLHGFEDVPTPEARALLARAAAAAKPGASPLAGQATLLAGLKDKVRTGSVVERLTALSQLAALVGGARPTAGGVLSPELAKPLGAALSEVGAALEAEAGKSAPSSARVLTAASVLLKERAAAGFAASYSELAKTSGVIDAALSTTADVTALGAKSDLKDLLERAGAAQARAAAKGSSLTAGLLTSASEMVSAQAAAEAEAAALVAEHAGHPATAAGLLVLADEARGQRGLGEHARSLLAQVIDEFAPAVDPAGVPADLLASIGPCSQVLDAVPGGLSAAELDLGKASVAQHAKRAKELGRPLLKLEASAVSLQGPTARTETFTGTFNRADDVEVANTEAMEAWEAKMREARKAQYDAENTYNHESSDSSLLDGVKRVGVNKSNRDSVDNYNAQAQREAARLADLRRDADRARATVSRLSNDRPPATVTKKGPSLEHGFTGERQRWVGSAERTLKLIGLQGGAVVLPVKVALAGDQSYERVKPQRGLPARNEWKTPEQMEAWLQDQLRSIQGVELCQRLDREFHQGLEARVAKVKAGPGDAAARNTEAAWLRFLFSPPSPEAAAALDVPAPGSKPAVAPAKAAVGSRRWSLEIFRPQAPAEAFALSPDGHRLVVSTPTGVEIVTVEQNHRPERHYGTQAIYSANVNASGRRIVLNWSTGVDLINLETMEVIYHVVWPGHTGRFSDDGKRLLVERIGDVSEIIDAVTGRKLDTLGEQADRTAVLNPSWRRSEAPALSWRWSGKNADSQLGNIRRAELTSSGLRVVEVQSGATVRDSATCTESANAVAISADGSAVAIGHYRTGNVICVFSEEP